MIDYDISQKVGSGWKDKDGNWIDFTERTVFDEDIKQILDSLCNKINRFLISSGYGDNFDIAIDYKEPNKYNGDSYTIKIIGKNYSDDIIVDRVQREKRRIFTEYEGSRYQAPCILILLDTDTRHRDNTASTYYNVYITYRGFEGKKYHTADWFPYDLKTWANQNRIERTQSIGNIVEKMWAKPIKPVITELLDAYGSLFINDKTSLYQDYTEPEETFENVRYKNTSNFRRNFNSYKNSLSESYNDIIQKRKQDVGRRIRLVNIADAENDPQMRKLIGQTGTIVKVDDGGSYQVDWDNFDSGLWVLIEDTVEFLDEAERTPQYEHRKSAIKNRRNTVNESMFTDNEIEFVARNIARHLGMGCGTSLSKDVYNDFVSLLQDDTTRDKLIDDMNIFYHQFFQI